MFASLTDNINDPFDAFYKYGRGDHRIYTILSSENDNDFTVLRRGS